jgi:hypothetical protein
MSLSFDGFVVAEGNRAFSAALDHDRPDTRPECQFRAATDVRVAREDGEFLLGGEQDVHPGNEDAEHASRLLVGPQPSAEIDVE